MRGGDHSLVNEIYEAAVIPERWPQVLERISALAGAAGGWIMTEKNGAKLWTTSERVRSGLAAFYSEGWHTQSTWAERSRAQKRLSFIDETDVFAPGETNEIPLYRDFIHRHGYGWSAGTFMQIPRGGHLFMRFERRFDSGPVDAEQKARLNLLRPHLARASLLFLHLGLQQARSTVSTLQLMDAPAAVLTHSGRLLACNTAMEARLSQVNIGSGDRITLKDNSAQRALSETLAQIMAGLFDQIQGPIAIPATEEHGAAIAYLVPMSGAAKDIFGHGTTLLIIRPAQPEHRPLDIVRMRFALEGGEARRMMHLMNSASPRLAAALLASKAAFEATLDQLPGTARTRQEAKLAAFLSKAGAHSQMGTEAGEALSGVPTAQT